MPETLTIPIGDRLWEAALEWSDDRMLDEEHAIEQKVEQALLEVEHLTSEATEVAFEVDVDDREIHFAPSEDLYDLLERQADRVGAEPGEVLGLHVELFARAFLPSDSKTPEGVPDVDDITSGAGMGNPGPGSPPGDNF